MHSHGSPILDPVHGHIPITRLESYVIATRQFQRLRFVLQNSAAYHTFPSAVHTRFSHSLGAMHVCGQLFNKAISNSNVETIRSIIDDANICFKSEIQSAEIVTLEEELSVRACKPSFIHSPLEGGENLKFFNNAHSVKDSKFSELFLLSSLWQAVRLGALLHDLGHLPMSHVFESAINDGKSDSDLGSFLHKETADKTKHYVGGLTKTRQDIFNILNNNWDNGLEFHELRGLFLTSKLFSVPQERYLNDKLEAYDRFILKLTQDILISCEQIIHVEDSGYDRFKFLSFIHSFFANDFIDADRIDYTDRDQISCGVYHSKLDVDKLYQGIFITKEDNLPTISFDSKSLPAIEQFFHQRYLSYKNIVYHHSVLRMNAILKAIIRRLLVVGVRADFTELVEILHKEGLWTKGQDDDGDIHYHLMPDFHGLESNDGVEVLFDDSWLRTLLLKCERRIAIYISKSTKDDEDKNLLRLKLLLPTFLYREVNNIYSIWKTEADYYYWLETIIQHLTEQEPDSPISECPKEEAMHIINRLIFEDINIGNDVLAFHDDARKELENEGVLLLLENITPKTPPKFYAADGKNIFPVFHIDKNQGDDSQELERKRINPQELPYLSCFSHIYKKTPPYYLFIVGDNLKGHDSLIQKYVSIVHEHFVRYIKDLLLIDNR